MKTSGELPAKYLIFIKFIMFLPFPYEIKALPCLALSISSQIWDLVPFGIKVQKWSQKGPNFGLMSQISDFTLRGASN